MENPPFEDVFAFGKGKFPFQNVNLLEGIWHGWIFAESDEPNATRHFLGGPNLRHVTDHIALMNWLLSYRASC